MPRDINGFEVLNEPLLTRDGLAVEQTTTVIPMDNPEETKRIAESIKDLLGYIAKLGAKLPKPVLALVLAAGWLAPLIIDGSLTGGSGSILSIVFSKANIGNIINSLLAGGGLYAIYNSSQLYRQADRAEQNQCSTLVVKSASHSDYTALRERCLGLAARLIISREELDKKDKLIEDKEVVIRSLLDEMRAAPDCSESSRKLLHTLTTLDAKTAAGSAAEVSSVVSSAAATTGSDSEPPVVSSRAAPAGSAKVVRFYNAKSRPATASEEAMGKALPGLEEEVSAMVPR